MKLRDEGFTFGVLDLTPNKITNGVTPYAIVGPSGAVAIHERSNGQRFATVYRTKAAAERALRQVEMPGFKLWAPDERF